MPWATQPPFPNFTVGPLLVNPYQGPLGAQIVYMNVLHPDSQPDVHYSANLIQDAALAPPKVKGSAVDEEKIDSAKQNEVNLNFRSPCNSMKDVVNSDFRSGTNKNTGLVIKSQGSNHDSFASNKQTCNTILTDGTNSLRTGSDNKKDRTLQNSVVYPIQKASSLIMQMNAPAETCLIKENEEIRNERRKQSNRESARRSRLRKQEKCQKLQETVNLLLSEISMLKRQLMKLSEDCGKLYEENKCLEEEIIATHGEDATSDLKGMRPASVER